MTKNGLITEVKACKQHEEQYLSAMLRLHKMKKEINILTDTQGQHNLNEKRSYQFQVNLHKRAINLEKRMTEQKQYLQRECIKLPGNIQGKELKNAVLNTFKIAGINIQKFPCSA